MNIREQVRDFIIENFLFGDDGLDDEASFFDGSILDSTGILELVGFLEETFEICVDDEELLPDNLDSVNSVVAYVEKKVRQNNRLRPKSQITFRQKAVFDCMG